MNVKLYVIEDNENEPLSGPKKTNPIQTQSKPVLSAVEWANFNTKKAGQKLNCRYNNTAK